MFPYQNFATNNVHFDVAAEPMLSPVITVAQDQSRRQMNVTVGGTVSSKAIQSTKSFLAQTYLTTSDLRLKRTLEDIDGTTALKYIMSIDPVRFSDENGCEMKAGFTAQGRGILGNNSMPPALEQRDGGILEVDNTALMAYLVAAIKELGAKVGQ